MLSSLKNEFGINESALVSAATLTLLQNEAFSGNICDSLRLISWRIFLDCISSTNQFQWANDFQKIQDNYSKLKKSVIPKTGDVKVDPLSALLGEKNEEWDRYYKSMELATFIKGDLERLYITGIEDDFFQLKWRKDVLLNVLLVWALDHPLISYRQGMHEICGPIIYLLEEGLQLFCLCFCMFQCWFHRVFAMDRNRHQLTFFRSIHEQTIHRRIYRVPLLCVVR